MPFDGSGNFTRVHNWQQDRDNGIRIVADRHDQEDDNFAQGFNQTFLRNGVVPMSGALNMNNNAIRGIAGGSAAQPTTTSVLDPTSGYFSPAAGQLGVSISGQQRGLWTATGLSVSGALAVTGNVTVGGNLVFTGNLSVPGTLTVTGLSTFNGGLNSTTGTFTGSASVGGALTVAGNVSGNTATFSGVTTFTGRSTHNGGITSTTGTFTGAVSTGALTAPTLVTTGNVTVGGALASGAINATGTVTSQQDVVAIGSVQARGAEAFRAQNNDGAYTFYNPAGTLRLGYMNNTAASMLIMNERSGAPTIIGSGGQSILHIATNGRVGINVAAPNAALDIFSPVSANQSADIRVSSVSNLEQFAIRLGSALTSGGVPFGRLVGPLDGAAWLAFYTGSPSAENMRILPNGRVLIGRTADALTGGSGVNLQIGSGAGAAGLTIHTGAASVGDIQFAREGGSSFQGLIRYDQVQNVLSLWTDATSRLQINASRAAFSIPVEASSYRLLGRTVLSANATNTFIQSGTGTLAITDATGATAIFTVANATGNVSTTGDILLPADKALRIGSNVFASVNSGVNRVSGTSTGLEVTTNTGVRVALFSSTGLAVTGTISSTGNLSVTGTITASGDITAFSDSRFKTNVRKVRGLAAVCAMEGVTFEHIGSKRKSAGVIAQELLKVAPELVHMDDIGHYAVNYNGLAAYFIEAIKDLNRIIADGHTK